MLPCLAYFPALIRDDVPLALRGVSNRAPWASTVPEERPVMPEQSARDAQQHYPNFRFLQDAARRGDSVLWNRLEGFGVPFLAAWKTRALSPFSLPFYLLPLNTAILVSLLAKCILAGWCTFYAARRLGFHPASALLAAVPFQLSVPIVLYGATPLADLLVWLPLLFIYAESFVLGHTRYWPLGALVVFLMALGGSPVGLLMVLLFAAVYAFVRCITDRQRTHPKSAVLGTALMMVLGLGLAAVQIVPYLEFRMHAVTESLGTADVLRLSSLLSLLSPGLLEGALENTPSAPWLIHLGLVQGMLFALWCAVRPFVHQGQRKRLEAAILTSLLFVLVAFLMHRNSGTESTFDATYLLVFHPFAFALLAAAAADEWVELDPDECKIAVIRFVIGAVLLGTTLVVGMTILLRQADATWGPIIGAGLVPSVIALGILCLLSITVLRPSHRVLGHGLSLLSAAALVWTLVSAVSYTPADKAFPEGPMIQAMQRTGARVGGGDELAAWPLAANGVPQVYTPNGIVLTAHATLLDPITTSPRLLRRLGVQTLLLSKAELQGPYATIRHELEIIDAFPTGFALVRDLGAPPPARIIYSGRLVENFDPATLAEDAPTAIEGLPIAEARDDHRYTAATFEAAHNTRTVIHVTTEDPGVLVLNEAWYPGWRATIDNIPTRLYRVDKLFRGVQVDAGTHEVVFTYKPFSLTLGLAVTGLSMLVVLYGLRNLLPAQRRP